MDEYTIAETTRTLQKQWTDGNYQSVWEQVTGHDSVTAAALAIYLHRYLCTLCGDADAVRMQRFFAARSTQTAKGKSPA